MIYTAMLVTRIASWNKNALIYDEDFPMRDWNYVGEVWDKSSFIMHMKWFFIYIFHKTETILWSISTILDEMKRIFQNSLKFYMIHARNILGLSLDADKDKGVNGCIVKSICHRKAAGLDGRIQVNKTFTLKQRRSTQSAGRWLHRQAERWKPAQCHKFTSSVHSEAGESVGNRNKVG